MDQLLAAAPEDTDIGGPTGHGEGHICMWAKPPEAFTGLSSRVMSAF